MNPSPDLAAFIEAVAADSGLRRSLAAEKSDDTFAAACAALAEKHSLHVTAEEVRALLRERTMAWLERHIR